MYAVHDLPVLVARDQGYFMDEGLDIDFVTTPGMAQVTSGHTATWDNVFERPLDAVYNEGGIDQYRMCEWGIMKRAVEADAEGLRPRKIVALGAAMSSFAIVVRRDSDAYEPEQLKDKAIAVTPFNGSNFTTLKMMEGFVTPEHVVPQVLEALPHAIRRGLRLPIVYNTSAFDSIESLRHMDGLEDIYMPDFKYWREEMTKTY